MASNVTWDSDGSTAIYERQTRIVRAAGALAELPVFLSSISALDRLWIGDLAGAEELIAESDSVAAINRQPALRPSPPCAFDAAGPRSRGDRADRSHRRTG